MNTKNYFHKINQNNIILKLSTKFLCVVCASVVIFMTVACNGIPGNNSEDTSLSENIYTYEMMFAYPIPEYPSDGGEAKEIILNALKEEGIEGFDYNITLVHPNAYYTRLNILANSLDLPDYFNININMIHFLSEQNMLLELDGYVKNMRNIISVVREEEFENIRHNDKLYAIPRGYRPEPFNGPQQFGIILRKDWLNNVGLSVPDTLDDFYNVLLAFRDGDPNRSGRGDTIPLGGTSYTNFTFVFGAYGISPHFWFEREGKLKQGMVLPETKQALSILQKWYSEGLIDPDFPIVTNANFDQKINSSKYGVFENAVWILNNPEADEKYELIKPPTGPFGFRGFPESGIGAEIMRAIRADVNNPELLLKVIDWSADISEKGGFHLLTYGIEGKDYVFDINNNRINMLVDYPDLNRRGFSNPVRFLPVRDSRWLNPEAIDALSITNEYIIENKFWGIVPAMQEYADLDDLWFEYFTKIITGIYDIEMWNDFVEKYYARGGLEIETQVNEEFYGE